MNLGATLRLDRCPHCSIAKPRLDSVHELTTADSEGDIKRRWRFYKCSTCGGIITAWAFLENRFYSSDQVRGMYPTAAALDDAIPDKAREYLRQAKESTHAPAGAIMLAASSVDAMLKAKGLTAGSLHVRIEDAADNHMITKEVAAWAHEVRLDANDQRHADEDAELPTDDDAQRCIEFTEALAQFLFVLPARVNRGRGENAEQVAGVGE